LTKPQKRAMCAALLLVLLSVGYETIPHALKQALLECIRPATVIMIPLPAECSPAQTGAPSYLLQIVRSQAAFYDLQLQTLVVCKMLRHFRRPSIDQSVSGLEIPKHWRPMYVGCCTYSFGRHFAIVAA
jgi:hypothetical protein